MTALKEHLMNWRKLGNEAPHRSVCKTPLTSLLRMNMTSVETDSADDTKGDTTSRKKNQNIILVKYHSPSKQMLWRESSAINYEITVKKTGTNWNLSTKKRKKKNLKSINWLENVLSPTN